MTLFDVESKNIINLLQNFENYNEILDSTNYINEDFYLFYIEKVFFFSIILFVQCLFSQIDVKFILKHRRDERIVYLKVFRVVHLD